MSEYRRMEVAVGIFVIAGLIALAILTLSVSGLTLAPSRHYALTARFASVGDLKRGAPVRIAGVTVGKVGKIALSDYAAEVRLDLDRRVAVPADTIASIRTSGLLGDAYVALVPGGSATDLHGGDRVAETEPALDLVDLIRRYAFGSPTGVGLGTGAGSGGHEPAAPASPDGGAEFPELE